MGKIPNFENLSLQTTEQLNPFAYWDSIENFNQTTQKIIQLQIKEESIKLNKKHVLISVD